MTHMPGVPVKFEEPDEWKPCLDTWRCQKCKGKNGKYRTHSSSCGGWDDDEIKCFDCGYVRWVDGIDS